MSAKLVERVHLNGGGLAVTIGFVTAVRSVVMCLLLTAPFIEPTVRDG